MILADTSAWIESFKHANHPLGRALAVEAVAMHDFVLGELVCGGLTPRHDEFELISRLPRASTVSNSEVVALVIERGLGNIGLGWTDAHLLASALIDDHSIMSHDRALVRAAEKCGVRAASTD